MSTSNSSPDKEKPSSTVSQSELTSPLSLFHTSASKSEVVPVPPEAIQESSLSGLPSHVDSDADIKRKRFCNTYNILSKSGLLDIALRTKELHRQNRRTQTDIDQLKENTDLFFQALWSGNTSISDKLLTRLQEEDREKDRGESCSDQLNDRLDQD